MPWIVHTTNEKEPMPKFNDSENIPPLLPEGDYVFCVTDFDSKISQGAKTRGSDMFELTLAIEPTGKQVYDNLIDHSTCGWKIDTFLKSAGVKLAKGESFEFRQDLANANAVKWVNPLGLRGWCRLVQEELPPKEGRKALTVNKVATYYTDKAKISARVVEEEEKPF